MVRRTARPPTIEERRAQWLKGALDLCVLARLTRGEAYGYEIAGDLTAAGLADVKGGTLYPLLGRLERDGLVTASWRASEQGPDRKYYTVTPLGRTSLDTAVEQWQDFVAAIDAALSTEGTT